MPKKSNLYLRAKNGLCSIWILMKIFERHSPICMPPTLHSLPQHNPGCYYLNGQNVFIQQNIIMQWQQRLFLRGLWLKFSKDNVTLPQHQMKSHSG